MSAEFISELDEEVANHGPAAVFTLNHEGSLQLDILRSRDFRSQNSPPYPLSPKPLHCVLVDESTGWPQYALITSTNLCQNHSRAQILVFEEEDAALAEIEVLKRKVWVDQG